MTLAYYGALEIVGVIIIIIIMANSKIWFTMFHSSVSVTLTSNQTVLRYDAAVCDKQVTV